MREGGREGERESVREGGREGERESVREGGRDGGRETYHEESDEERSSLDQEKSKGIKYIQCHNTCPQYIVHNFGVVILIRNVTVYG